MNKHGLTKENLVVTLPPALRADPSVVALAEALGEVLAARPAEIDRLRIYPVIDQLDEKLLDILAYDFKVDWWDADWAIGQKRRTLKTSWQVHKTMGTKAAVEKAASAIYPMARVLEWFEYGGEPYHFQLDVDLPESDWTPERHKKLMWGLQYYKNLRSHLDSVVYRIQPVVLQNHQAMWFAAMYIGLRARIQQQVLLNGLLLTVWIRHELELTAGLFIRVAAEGNKAVSMSRLLARVRLNNWGLEPVRLNGERRLDGMWRLDQGTVPGPAMSKVAVTARAVAENRASAAVTADTMWRLDGSKRLDGAKKLNAAIRRSEL